MQKKITNFSIFLMSVSVWLTSCHWQPEEKTQSYNPKASTYNVQLGLAYLQQGNRQRAKQKLLKALQQSPNSPEANDAMAFYLENTQDIHDAEKYYQQAIHFSPHNGASLNNYGTFLCRQKIYNKADIYFRKAIAEPTYLNTAKAYENAGLCALAASHNDRARYYFKKAKEQDPNLKLSIEEF